MLVLIAVCNALFAGGLLVCAGDLSVNQPWNRVIDQLERWDARKMLSPAGFSWGRSRSLPVEQLENLTYELSAALSAGETIPVALRQAVNHTQPPLNHVLSGVLQAYDAGVPLESALERLRDTDAKSSGEVDYLVQTLALSHRLGGRAQEALSGYSQILRWERDRQALVQVKTSESRLTAVLLTLIPPVMAGYFGWQTPAMLQPLWETGTGRLALVYAVCSWLMGVWILRRMVRGIEQ